MTISRLLATGFLGGDWGWLLILVYICVGALLVFGAWAIIYNLYLTFGPPKPRSRKFIILACAASVTASLLLLAGSLVFAPDGNNYFLRSLGVVALVLSGIGTAKVWRAKRPASS